MAVAGRPARVAIVGASSLRGKELKQVLEDRHFASDIILLDESPMAGTLTEAAGEPTFIRTLEEDSFEKARFAFFAGTPSDAERNWALAQRSGATVIDLTGGVAASARAIFSIPSLDSVLPAALNLGTNGSVNPQPYFSVSAPAIIACTLAAGLAGFSLQRIVLVMFPPVSDRDQAGVDELESQSASLLSFRPIQQTVFDAQVAFNLLSGYGEESKLSLADSRTQIAAQVVKYLDGRAPVPSIQLVQAPVFYGYAFCAYVEPAPGMRPGDLEESLAKLDVKTRVPQLTNVSVAGESQIHIAPIEPDPNISTGFWLWGVADHLRLAATNAARIAEGVLAKSQV